MRNNGENKIGGTCKTDGKYLLLSRFRRFVYAPLCPCRFYRFRIDSSLDDKHCIDTSVLVSDDRLRPIVTPVTLPLALSTDSLVTGGVPLLR